MYRWLLGSWKIQNTSPFHESMRQKQRKGLINLKGNPNDQNSSSSFCTLMAIRAYGLRGRFKTLETLQRLRERTFSKGKCRRDDDHRASSEENEESLTIVLNASMFYNDGCWVRKFRQKLWEKIFSKQDHFCNEHLKKGFWTYFERISNSKVE